MDKIDRMLLKAGMPASVMGYQYTHDAITMIQREPRYQKELTKRLYPELAERYGTTQGSVERAIRHAVEITFDRMTPELLEELFGNSVASRKGKATNGEFLAVMALHLREDPVCG